MAEITAKEIAAMIGMSPAAISLALNGKPGVSDKTRAQVMEIAAQYGYAVRRGPVGDSSAKKNLCFLIYVDQVASIAEYTSFSTFVVHGLEARAMGYHTLIRYFTAGASLENLLGQQLPDAFFAENDVIAAATIRALNSHGINVPEQVSVIGFDDIPICEMTDPPLTTIHSFKELLGSGAVDLIHRRLQAGETTAIAQKNGSAKNNDLHTTCHPWQCHEKRLNLNDCKRRRTENHRPGDAYMLTQRLFDVLPDGSEVNEYTLKNASGASVSFLNLGAALRSVCVPDRNGTLQNVTLAHSRGMDYLHTQTYAGAICGRVANRVADAAFSLHGQKYRLTANDGNNQLHGGSNGFHQRLWHAVPAANTVRFSLLSHHCEEGYPGKMIVYVCYGWSEDNCLSISYEASSDQDTVCNLTNHAYWSMGGYTDADPLAQTIQIHADFYTPIDQAVLPTGEIQPVCGAFDLREPKRIADGKCAADAQIQLVDGYDHNFVLRDYAPDALSLAACLSDTGSGRQMQVFTTMPGLQFFSGAMKPDGHTGVALETQLFPNAMRYWWFPSIVLQSGKLWKSQTEYRFSVMD